MHRRHFAAVIAPTIATAILISLLACLRTRAAELRVINSKYCYALLSGRIEKGDTDKIVTIMETIPWEAVRDGRTSRALCLNSHGGSYAEAVRIAKLLTGHRENGEYFERVGTVVDKGMKCEYACAITFLGGSRHLVETAFQEDRTLHENGVLAFGLPPLATDFKGIASQKDLENAYNEGVAVITELLSIQKYKSTYTFFPANLLSEVLRLNPGTLMRIRPGRSLESMTVKFIKNDGTCHLYSLNKGHETTDCSQIRSY